MLLFLIHGAIWYLILGFIFTILIVTKEAVETPKDWFTVKKVLGVLPKILVSPLIYPYLISQFLKHC